VYRKETNILTLDILTGALTHALNPRLFGTRLCFFQICPKVMTKQEYEGAGVFLVDDNFIVMPTADSLSVCNLTGSKSWVKQVDDIGI
jgi:hypothetical protein